MDKRQEFNKIKAKDHEAYTTMTVLGILIPAVSFIVGIVYLTKDRTVDKKLGEHMVALSVLLVFVYAVIWMLVAGFQHTAQVVGS